MPGSLRRLTRPRASSATIAGALLVLLSVVHPAVLLGEYASTAFGAVLAFEGPAADGPFQLYNSLRRVADGQQPGVDFTFFHGIGVPYLHYPVFAAFGGTVYASEVARVLVSPALFLIVTVAFFAALTGSWRRTAVLAGATVAGAYLLGFNAVIGPGNSLLGARSSMPVLFVALLFWQHFRGRRAGWYADVPAGVLLALALLLGTEQGIAVVVGHVIAVTVAGDGSLPERLVVAGRRVAVAAAGTLLLTTLLSRSVTGALASLRYNFTEVPHDQFWYFGAPPNAFVTQAHHLFADWRFLLPVLAAALIVVAVALLRGRGALTAPAATALLTLVIYGAISAAAYLGIQVDTAAEPCARAALLAAVALTYLLVYGRRERHGDGWAARPLTSLAMPDVRSALQGAAMLALAISLLLSQPGQVLVAARAAQSFAGNGGQLGPGLAEFSRRSEELIGRRTCESEGPGYLWSTYAGILEAERDCFHPYNDYIIHALGPERRTDYVEAFEELDPEIVQTLRRATFGYEDWLRVTSWEFYETLFQDYRPLGLTNTSVLWERAERPGQGLRLGPWVESGPAATDDQFFVPVTGTPEVLVVEMGYEASNPFGGLPLVGQVPRYFVSPQPQLLSVPVPLDPTRSSVTFPVVLPEGTSVVDVQTAALSLVPGADLDITSVRYRFGSIPSDPAWREAFYG